MLQYVALATCGHWGGVVVSGSLWSLPLGPRAQPRSPSWKGTGVAEVVKGELPAEAYRWPFPCPGLPHHRRLPDPAESQGAARLKVACLQEPRFGREATDPRAPASRTCRSLWGSSPRGSCRTGPLPPPGRSHCAMLLPGHQALAPSPLFSLGTLCPGYRARLELLKAFFGAGVDWGHSGPAEGPLAVLCHSLPRLLLRLGGGTWQMSQKPLLGLVLRFPHGESDAVREPRSRQAQVTPSVPLSLRAYVCL